MKKFLLMAILPLGFIAYSQGYPGNYENGDIVHNFTVTDTKGVEHSLYDITASGKYVYLDFFFVDCPPCKTSYPIFAELYDKYGCNEGDIFTISISGKPEDTNARITQFQETYGGPSNHPPAAGPQGGSLGVVDDFFIHGYPTFCLIGPDNKMIDRQIWPFDVEAFEDVLPNGVHPQVMECTPMSNTDVDNSQLKLFPTVSDGNVKLEFEKLSDADVSIFDVSGKKVFDKKYSKSKSIDLNLDLSTGLYFMKAEFSNGTSAVKKFYIKK